MTKKVLMLLFCSVLIFSLNSCEKEDDNVSSYAKITVKKQGKVQSGVTVYMFSSESKEVGIFSAFSADKQVVTDADGVATFELQDVYDLNTIDSQTTLYFAVFKGDIVLGQTAITIKKDETKTATINI